MDAWTTDKRIRFLTNLNAMYDNINSDEQRRSYQRTEEEKHLLVTRDGINLKH